jgi:hypothetical protein
MVSPVLNATPRIAWGVAARALPGLACSGDSHLVKVSANRVLLAVVDGVGHGQEATEAARVAVGVLERNAEEPLVPLVRLCHEALRKTRGAVMTIATLNPWWAGTLTWLGVGNVEAMLLRADANGRRDTERAVLRGGLVGLRLPDLRADTVSVAPGDLLVFVTDGIGVGFASGWLRGDPPQQVADHIMERHFKRSDDALVLAVRYLGAPHE